ncbi:MAG: hypothetical protein M5U28_27250 [Sandaracinaceae bacterium]|nr:hypothetical protein [Sandaracinaceae bacterium]
MRDDELRDLFVSPSPAGGVLVREGVDRSTLSRALARAGVVLEDAAS